ncbi:hypothetical protein LC087_08680 [Bacillus carboniphilus]|uniref:Uncharacterized protein n=1 Tax=Bacillus carboniphilus TaxID=86663 RepID=A0ABY9JXR9_9BACI|nr:hypothetical protein [Bacillus carboniphilus]WLR44140.1 hypothetical protein LC087_08680 [Bacillus carboniphilus]
MGFMEVLGVSIITGLLSIFTFYFTFSKKAEDFYKETNDGFDDTGFFLITGWIFMGFHKLFKTVSKNHHTLALRILMFCGGMVFLAMSIGIWVVT